MLEIWLQILEFLSYLLSDFSNCSKQNDGYLMNFHVICVSTFSAKSLLQQCKLQGNIARATRYDAAHLQRGVRKVQ